MLLSRTLARARIKAGHRPGLLAAWGPVGFDAACLMVLFALAWRPFQALTAAFDLPLWAQMAALLAVGLIPIQGVLILSSLWATKSRFIEDLTDG